jgi:hypothetical protein
LDDAGAAKGSLFLDDGSSFAFLTGEYVNAHITFAKGVLKYEPVHVGFPAALRFERIVILGWRFRSPGAKHTARLEKQAKDLEVTREAVGGGLEPRALVVRNPQIPVDKAWALFVH